MEVAQIWRSFFKEWPSGLPHRGVLVTSLNEQINFVNYVMSDTMVIVERMAPDSVGARRVALPYQKIEAIKIIDPIKTQVLTSAGFQEPPATRA